MVTAIIERSERTREHLKAEVIKFCNEQGIHVHDYDSEKQNTIMFIKERNKRFEASDNLRRNNDSLQAVIITNFDYYGDRGIRGVISSEFRCNLLVFICVPNVHDIPARQKPNIEYQIIQSKEGHVFTVQLDNKNYHPSLFILLENDQMVSK